MTSDGLLSPQRKTIRLPWKSSPSPKASVIPLPLGTPELQASQTRPETQSNPVAPTQEPSQPPVKPRQRPNSQSRRSLLFKKNKKDPDLPETVGSISNKQNSPEAPRKPGRQRSLSLIDPSRPVLDSVGVAGEDSQDGFKALSRRHLKAMEEVGDLVCRQYEMKEIEVERGRHGHQDRSLSLSSTLDTSESSDSSHRSLDSISFGSSQQFQSESSSDSIRRGSTSMCRQTSDSIVLPSSITSDSFTRSFSKARNRASKSITGASVEDYRRWYSDEPFLPPTQESSLIEPPVPKTPVRSNSSSIPENDGIVLIPIISPEEFCKAARSTPMTKQVSDGIASLPPPPTPRRTKTGTKSMGNLLMLSSSRQGGPNAHRIKRSPQGADERFAQLDSSQVPTRNAQRAAVSSRPVRVHGRKNSRDFISRPTSSSSTTSPFSAGKEVKLLQAASTNESSKPLSRSIRSRPSTSSAIENSTSTRSSTSALISTAVSTSASNSSLLFRPPNLRKLSAGHTPPVPNYDCIEFSLQVENFSKIKLRKRSKSDSRAIRKSSSSKSLNGLGLEVNVLLQSSTGGGSSFHAGEKLRPPMPNINLRNESDLLGFELLQIERDNRRNPSPFMTPTFGSSFSPKEGSVVSDDGSGRNSLFDGSDDEEQEVV